MLIPFMPPPGLNSDDTTFKAEGRWADGNNVRFVNGSPQVIGESKALFSALGGAVYNMFAWDRSGTTHIAYGRGSNVYIASGIVSPTDRTPASMGSGYTAYAFAAWGTDLLFAPSGKTLYQWQGSGNAAEITQAPDRITWMLVTRRQVLAFGCNEVSSGTFNNLCIRGSDLENNTNWTPTSTNNSFEDIIDGAGKIVTAREIGDYVAVWTDNMLYLGSFQGNPSQVYRWERVASDSGIIGPNAVAIVGSTAYWIGHDLQLRSWSVGAEPVIIPCPIFRAFLASASAVTPSLMAVTHVAKFNEIWIQWQAAGSGGYIAVSLNDGAWSKGNLERYSALCSDMLGAVLGTNGYLSNLITADGNGVVYAAECSMDQSEIGFTSWYIQSADQYLDNGGRRMMIRGVRPDFRSAAGTLPALSVSLTVYVRDRPQSTATTKGPYTITAGATKKDFRASGMIAAIRLGQQDGLIDRELRIGKLEFDAVPMGER